MGVSSEGRERGRGRKRYEMGGRAELCVCEGEREE